MALEVLKICYFISLYIWLYSPMITKLLPRASWRSWARSGRGSWGRGWGRRRGQRGTGGHLAPVHWPRLAAGVSWDHNDRSDGLIWPGNFICMPWTDLRITAAVTSSLSGSVCGVLDGCISLSQIPGSITLDYSHPALTTAPINLVNIFWIRKTILSWT